MFFFLFHFLASLYFLGFPHEKQLYTEIKREKWKNITFFPCMYGINKSASNFNFQSPRNLLCLIRPLNLVVSCNLITSRGDQVTSKAFTDDYANSRLSLGELLTRGSNFQSLFRVKLLCLSSFTQTHCLPLALLGTKLSLEITEPESLFKKTSAMPKNAFHFLRVQF